MYRDIVVIGASAGGVEAITQLSAGLSDECKASIFLVIHASPESPRMLDEIITRSGCLPASYPADGEKIQPGKITLPLQATTFLWIPNM